MNNLEAENTTSARPSSRVRYMLLWKVLPGDCFRKLSANHPDILANDPDYCLVMPTVQAPNLARLLLLKQTGDMSVWKVLRRMPLS